MSGQQKSDRSKKVKKAIAKKRIVKKTTEISGVGGTMPMLALQNTNLFGQNTPQIANTESNYDSWDSHKGTQD